MCPIFIEAVAVFIVWQLDLQLPVQSVPVTTKVVSSWRGVLDTPRYSWNIVQSGVKHHKPQNLTKHRLYAEMIANKLKRWATRTPTSVLISELLVRVLFVQFLFFPTLNFLYYIPPPPHTHTLWWGDILFLSCPSVRHTVYQRNSSQTTEYNFMKLGR